MCYCITALNKMQNIFYYNITTITYNLNTVFISKYYITDLVHRILGILFVLELLILPIINSNLFCKFKNYKIYKIYKNYLYVRNVIYLFLDYIFTALLLKRILILINILKFLFYTKSNIV